MTTGSSTMSGGARSTVYTTVVQTITSCPPNVASCPAGQGTQTQRPLVPANSTTTVIARPTTAFPLQSINAGSSLGGMGLPITVVLASCFAFAVALL